MTPKLAAATRLGSVSLTVTDLARSAAFYTENVGLTLLDQEGAEARLGSGDSVLLHLVENAAAKHRPGTTGLYHFALLLPSRAALASALRRLVATRTRLSGASDHGVSEALYLSDPDGIGIEIYRDRPREAWPRSGDGLAMVTEALDLEDLLAEGGQAEEGGITLGHVHLHVSQLSAAQQFYVDIFGFELMQRYGRQALFVAAGLYHHHIGLNIWQGVGAPPPLEPATGLRHFEIVLANAAERAGLQERLDAAGIPWRAVGENIHLRDPSGNGIVVVV